MVRNALRSTPVYVMRRHDGVDSTAWRFNFCDKALFKNKQFPSHISHSCRNSEEILLKTSCRLSPTLFCCGGFLPCVLPSNVNGPFSIHVELSESLEYLVPIEKHGNEVSSVVLAIKKAKSVEGHGGSSEPRAETQTTSAGTMPSFITTFFLSEEVVPSYGALHFANQFNPITVTAKDQSNH